MNADVWNQFRPTAQAQREIDKFLKDPTLALEQRSGTTYYSGTLYQRDGGACSDKRKVVVADTGKETGLTVVSTSPMKTANPVVLVVHYPDGLVDWREGKLRNSRAGRRMADRNDRGCSRFVSEFSVASR